MGVTVESLKAPTSVGSYTTTDTSATLDSAVQNSTGYATWDPGGSHEELVYWGGKTGVQVTSLLRGLSKTALTNTEVAGNKKTHDDGETFAVTNAHYIINDKASKSSDETIAGAWTFTPAPKSSAAATATTELMRYDETCRLTGDQTVAGIKTFSSFPITPSAAPTTDYQASNKKYVDDQVSNTKAENTRDDNSVIGETGTAGMVYSIEPLVNTDGSSDADFGRDAASNGIKQAQSFIAGSTASTFSMTVSLKKQGAPADNVYITIETDNAGEPSGTPVTNGTSNDVAAGSVGAGYTDVSFSWGSDPTLVAGTKYWFVLQRDGANSDVNYYQVQYGSNSAFRAGAALKYTGSWVVNTGANDDLRFSIAGVSATAVKASTSTTNSSRGQLKMKGVLYENATAGDTDKLIATSGVVDVVTGLTNGADYYVSSTAGELSASEQLVKIGTAIAPTSLLIDIDRTLITSSAGAGDANKAVATNTSGFVDNTFINTGVSNGQIPVMDATGYPAADGSQITNVSANFALGSGTRTNAQGSGTDDINTVGFQPSLVEIQANCVISGTETRWCFGYSDGTNNYCQGLLINAEATSAVSSDTSYVVNFDDGGGNTWTATITVDSAGFNIVWTKGGATGTVYYNWKAIR